MRRHLKRICLPFLLCWSTYCLRQLIAWPAVNVCPIHLKIVQIRLREIAKKVERLTEYEIFYTTGSEVMHSVSYRDHVQFYEGMMRFEP